MRKFHKTTIVLEVLSEDEGVEDMGLGEIAEAISTGDCVGRHKVQSVKALGGKAVVRALYDFGSDPGFFQLDENGKDI